jgi:tetratricopeptide (TPR) repeat protein
LNIIGLIFYGQRNPSRPLPSLKKALGVCKKSLKMRKRWGELGLVAESENAIGLILYEQAKWLGRSDKEKAVQLLNEKSLTYLKSALDKKERIGDYRGCQQCFRNLGLTYDLLRDFVPKEDKEKYMGESLRVYEEELNYMKKMLNPPTERFLEVQYRMGELCIQLSKTKEAIELLKEVVKERDEIGDWHNKARALNSLREAYEKTGQKSECEDCCQAIISIYQNVLQNEKMIKEMKDAKIKFENAIKEILPSTSNSLQKMMLTSKVEEISNIIETLKRKIGK